MNKQDIIRGLKSEYGEFVSVTEISQYLRVDRGTTRGMLYGISFLPCGRKKLYHIADVAQRVMERMEV